MTQFLPPNLLAMFAPRPPIPFMPPPDKKPHRPYTGIADFVKEFEGNSFFLVIFCYLLFVLFMCFLLYFK
jgi:hypothetical protein